MAANGLKRAGSAALDQLPRLRAILTDTDAQVREAVRDALAHLESLSDASSPSP